MGSSMMKTTLREIRQSLGRYLAIMAIVALGVGLFCGLKVTRDVMVKSAQQSKTTEAKRQRKRKRPPFFWRFCFLKGFPCDTIL